MIMNLDSIVADVALAPKEERVDLARKLRDRCLGRGIYLASIGRYYRAIARGDIGPITIPALNLRGLTYDLARAAWRAALRLDAGPPIFELAPSESEVSDQPFMEFAALVLAAALREEVRGPVFLQGDHFHVDATSAVSSMQALCLEALDAGFYQVDIDAADLLPDGDAAGDSIHRANAEVTAAMTAFIRRHQPPGSDVVVGGEVGVIGGRDTTPTDLRQYLDATRESLPGDVPGLGKVSVQTGTQHGGLVLADGSLGTMPLDLGLASRLSRIAREEYGLPGLVQHGASTLRLEQLRKLPEAGVVEVHLATGIQNLVLDHPAFPADLRLSIQEHLAAEARDTGSGAESGVYAEASELTEQQRFYHSRWRAWGLFKRELCHLPASVRDAIGASAEAWFADLFVALGTAGRRSELDSLYAADGGGHP